MSVDVVCVGAHPDDVEIGMGGAVAVMADAGLEVAIVDLTDGEPTPRGSRETRLREADEAASVLGAQRRVLGMKNRELFDDVAARQALAVVLRELRPRVLFGPFGMDSHPDHVATAAIVDAARFYGKFVKTDMAGEPHYVPRSLGYFALHLRTPERPSFALDVSNGLERKMEALGCYASQFGDDRGKRLLDEVRVRSAYWGYLLGVEAAEPFHSAELLGVGSVADLL